MSLLPLEPLEIAAGWVFGHEGSIPACEPSGGFRAALEAMLLEALALGPCFVSFSGGRDSSAIVAVAAAVARREGLALPVPVTSRHPGVPSAAEESWQRTVVDHLGLSDWIRVSVDPAEFDLVGSRAQHQLVRHGLVWPAAAYVRAPTFEQAAGGILISGDGGDELFGRRRSYDIMTTMRRLGRVPIRTLPSTLATLAPATLRASRARRQYKIEQAFPWLTDTGRSLVIDAMSQSVASEPLRWDHSTRWYMTRRACTVAKSAFEIMSADFNVKLLHPFIETPVIQAICSEVGPLGRWNRTEMMYRFFGDLLPPAILGRSDKAYFNAAFFSEHTRAFARAWDGTGLSLDLVDGERLRAEWLSDMPSAQTALLVQSAWLACQ